MKVQVTSLQRNNHGSKITQEKIKKIFWNFWNIENMDPETIPRKKRIINLYNN